MKERINIWVWLTGLGLATGTILLIQGQITAGIITMISVQGLAIVTSIRTGILYSTGVQERVIVDREDREEILLLLHNSCQVNRCTEDCGTEKVHEMVERIHEVIADNPLVETARDDDGIIYYLYSCHSWISFRVESKYHLVVKFPNRETARFRYK